MFGSGQEALDHFLIPSFFKQGREKGKRITGKSRGQNSCLSGRSILKIYSSRVCILNISKSKPNISWSPLLILANQE